MEDDLKSETTKQECRIPPFQNGNSRNALALVTPNCFFCSLDLKDAYFSVCVNESSQEFLKFFSGKANFTHLLLSQMDLPVAPDFLQNC